MEYKIEYLPVYHKRNLTAERLYNFSRIFMLIGLAMFVGILWHNRAYVQQGLIALEAFAVQLQNGQDAFDMIATFCGSIFGGVSG